MKRFYYEQTATLARVRQLARFIKKYSKFGAYMEVTETTKAGYEVELFCPKTHIDIFGNRAISQARPTRTMPDALHPLVLVPLGTINNTTGSF